MSLVPGSRAPIFTLPDQHGSTFNSADLVGSKALLVLFYPFAFTGVCTGELTGIRDNLSAFESDTTTVAAISCDSIYALRIYADRDALFFPLLSDFWPHGQVARSFDAFDEDAGCPTRSAFVQDINGQLAWSTHSDMGTPRNLDEMAHHLRAAT